jgi:hypothetical protein
MARSGRRRAQRVLVPGQLAATQGFSAMQRTAMELWKSESSSGKQWATALASVAAGLVLVVGFRDFRAAGNNALAGFLLGLLLLSIGLMGLLYSGKQVVLIDPVRRRITVEDSNVLGGKTRLIPFDAIDDIGIGYLGKSSSYVRCYYLVLKLRSGESYALFAPGRFFAGASDRLIVEGWRQRLQGCMRSLS